MPKPKFPVKSQGEGESDGTLHAGILPELEKLAFFNSYSLTARPLSRICVAFSPETLTWQEIFSLRRMLNVLMVKRAAMMVKRKGGANHIEDKIKECDQVSTALSSREAAKGQQAHRFAKRQRGKGCARRGAMFTF